MNKLLVFLLLTAACAGVAQTATPYASAPASSYPSAPAFTNYIGPWFTPTNGANLFSSNFSVLLLNLEADAQQLLPVLQSLNSSSFVANSNLLASLAIVGYSATNSYLYKATLPGGSTVTSLP